jgi:hypothetical protein
VAWAVAGRRANPRHRLIQRCFDFDMTKEHRARSQPLSPEDPAREHLLEKIELH